MIYRPAPREQRIAAALLAVAALVLLYLLCVHWWFTAPLQQAVDEMQALKEAQRRYVAANAQRQTLEGDLAQAQRQPLSAESMLAGPDVGSATGQLMQLISARLQPYGTAGSGCVILNRMPLTPTDAQEGAIQVKIKVDLECGIEPLAGLLYALETGQPFLFVESLSVRRREGADNGQHRLAVQILVSGYLKTDQVSVTP